MLGVVLQGLYVVNVETSTSNQEWTISRVPNRVLQSRHPDRNLFVPTTRSNSLLNLLIFFSISRVVFLEFSTISTLNFSSKNPFSRGYDIWGMHSAFQ